MKFHPIDICNIFLNFRQKLSYIYYPLDDVKFFMIHSVIKESISLQI